MVQLSVPLLLCLASILLPAAIARLAFGVWPLELSLLVGAWVGTPTLLAIGLAKLGRSPLPGYAAWITLVSLGAFFVPWVFTFVTPTAVLVGGLTCALLRRGFFSPHHSRDADRADAA